MCFDFTDIYGIIRTKRKCVMKFQKLLKHERCHYREKGFLFKKSIEFRKGSCIISICREIKRIKE